MTVLHLLVGHQSGIYVFYTLHYSLLNILLWIDMLMNRRRYNILRYFLPVNSLKLFSLLCAEKISRFTWIIRDTRTKKYLLICYKSDLILTIYFEKWTFLNCCSYASMRSAPIHVTLSYQEHSVDNWEYVFDSQKSDDAHVHLSYGLALQISEKWWFDFWRCPELI